MKHMRSIFIFAVASLLLVLPGATQIGGDQGYFAIDSNPSGASVVFDGSYKGTTPVTVTVYTTGVPEHTLSLTLDGYYPYSQTISENPAMGETIPINADLVFIPVTLPPTPIGGGKGYYAISSVPSGASVYFDNIYQGTSPVTVEVSSTGTPGHVIRVTAPGYQEWDASYQGNPAEGQTIIVNAYLTPVSQYGSLSVDSNPERATAILDGGSSQFTPCTFNNVLPGSHTIQLSMAGYQPYSTTVSVNAGKSTYVFGTLTAVAPATGSIYATSLPQGASVYVDGRYYGPAPQLASGLSPGSHQVRLSLQGFQDWSGQVQVTAGVTTTVSQTLLATPTGRPTVAPGTGTLQVSSSPAGAQVFLDNVYMGISPLNLPGVSTGSHLVLLKLPGYSDWEVSAQVAAGQTTPVTAILVPVTTPTPTKGSLPGMLALVALSIVSIVFWSRKR
ncbi:MAG: PEGA domain-containing protein [Methanoregulaceae archaeon]|nr:PEGA domain-containing protein [Methanoregulaceae archaeon]